MQSVNTANVTVAPDLQAQLAKCKPGQTKEMSVTVSMGQDGQVTLTSGGGTYEEEPPAKPVKKGSRPKPVMDAIAAM